MKESLMDVLCCPLDKSELELEVIREDDEEILEGRQIGRASCRERVCLYV